MTSIMSHFPEFFSAAMMTLSLVTAALIISVVLALFMTFGIVSKRQYVARPLRALVFFIRGTPLLVQIFLIYYGLAQIAWLRESFLWVLFREPFFCAVFALALNSAAYSTALFRGAIDSVPHGEKEACRALGMKDFTMMRCVIIPRAIRLALPAYSNEVIIVLKSTSLASTITLLELTGMTQLLIAETFNPAFFLIAGAIYLTLNAVILSGFAILSKRLSF